MQLLKNVSAETFLFETSSTPLLDMYNFQCGLQILKV